jgi:uncharacterized protein (DUF1800 family)
MPRRNMLRALPLSLALLTALGACAATSRPTPAADGLPSSRVVVVTPSEPRDLTADEQIHHVLDRLAFGARPGDLAKVRAMGVDQWIGLQLAPDHIDDRAIAPVLATYEELNKPTTELVSLYNEGQKALRQQGKQLAAQGDTSAKKDARAEVLKQNPQLRDLVRQNQRLVGEEQSAKLARAVGSDRQLEEVMTDFWENHFTVFAGKGLTRLFIPSYDRDVIRPRALGHFRDLLGAVAKSPAMLFFLDQWQSAADSTHPTLAARGQFNPQQLTPAQRARLAALTPEQRQQLTARLPQAARNRGLNENYARELLELHTLGVDGGYTQHDVIEVARALTGWTMNPQQGAEFVFRPAIHDAGEKVVLGHVLPAGRGIEDGEEVLDILARDPHTARFIARKLAVRFVSDTPPQALVDRAAQTYMKTDGDIREVVRTIVTSPEFFGRAAYRSKVKSPFELVASALRAVGAAPDTTARSAQLVAYLGQPIFGHQAPNGWPETGESWMNTGAILNRINFGMALAAGRLPGASVAQWADAERLRDAPREQQVDAVIGAFLGGRASPDTRDILLKGENPMAAKLSSLADTTHAMGTTGTMGAASPRRDVAPGKNGLARPAIQQVIARPAQLSGLSQVVGLAIGAPEFQRR